jgi:hypothetical protein
VMNSGPPRSAATYSMQAAENWNGSLVLVSYRHNRSGLSATDLIIAWFAATQSCRSRQVPLVP